MRLVDHALAYAARGWPIFPLKPRGKRPLVYRGLLEATTDPNIIERWWDRWPEANIGVATGEGMGLWVLDVDGEDGAQSLAELEAELGELPATIEQRTGSGGRHLFFAWSDREIRNRQSIRPGIDVRGNGGYVVLPPSIHPTGDAYGWTSEASPVRATDEWVDLVAPKKKTVPPWERVSPPALRRASTGRGAVADRARAYLATCDPAVQGSGGHNALLWAARCMVRGFLLEDEVARELLWDTYNPRCVPPWDRSSRSEARDFDRKLREARTAPFDKRDGWLLDEQGIRHWIQGDDRAAIENGRASAAALLAAAPAEPDEEPVEREGFPVELFPLPIAEFCRQVAEAHDVDLSFATLPALVVAGACMGNAWRLRLKKGYVVPPIIWGAIVAVSGSNKSGPLSQVVAPLNRPAPRDTHNILSPTGKNYTGDCTIESLISMLDENPRGMMVYRDELRAWVGGFDKYRKGGGGDEQTWIELWGGGPYQLNRKTDKEDVFIPSASCCVLGGIQPAILSQCFDPAKFASGLAPRLLLTCPPERRAGWSDVEVDDEKVELWTNVLNWFRTRPFRAYRTAGLSGKAEYEPRILSLTDEAQDRVRTFWDDSGHEQFEMSDPNGKSLIAKSRTYAGRLALVHHGLKLACEGEPEDEDDYGEVGLDSVRAGIAWSQWFLAEQLRLYGYGVETFRQEQAEYLAGLIREKFPAGVVSARQLQRRNSRRYPKAKHAKAAMRQLVACGGAAWVDERKTRIRLRSAS